MFDPRLASWQKLRKDIAQYDLKTSLEHINYFWESAPFTPYYLDWDKPESWPDPWTLVSENLYCDLAKALAMLYTVYFTEHKSQITVELRIYKCLLTGYEYNLIWINNGEFILNYSNEIVNTEHMQKDLKLLKAYSIEELNLDRY